MSDIYGQLTEHSEYPIEDPRHFTITIRIHDFEKPKGRPYLRTTGDDPFCARCGYHKDSAIHPKEIK